MVRIGVTGCLGRMGAQLVAAIESTKGCTLAGGTVRPNHPYVGQPFKSIILESDPEKVFQSSQVIIDFTTAGSTEHHLDLAKKYKTPMVIGTTGFSSQTDHAITQASKTISLVQAFNMSVGINLLLNLVEKTSALLDKSYDIEIFEMHHRHKKDAPSGTTIHLGEAAARGRKINLPPKISTDRNHLRQEGEIGFSASRGGGVPGDHAVSFAGEGEVLSLSHRSLTPAIYAQGAVRAALWLLDKTPGRYGMKDVLGI